LSRVVDSMDLRAVPCLAAQLHRRLEEVHVQMQYIVDAIHGFQP
jgi:hypothetical protein